MQMLQSDWLSTRILSAIRMQWLLVVHEMPCFYSFSEVLEGILDVNGYLIPEKTKRSTFTVS